MNESALAHNPQEQTEHIPETSFAITDIESETQTLRYFLETGYWAETFYKTYPELRNLKPEQYKGFLERLHEQKKEELAAAQRQLKIEWDTVGPHYLQALSEYFGTAWPIEMSVIKGYITVLPVYPRDLAKYRFLVGYKDVQKMVETCAHEIQHFLWFKKWKEVFPESDPEEYNRPHLAWRLSEIMDPIIMQCHPKIKALIKPKYWGYPSFTSVTIGSESMTEHFKKLYEQCLASGEPFESTLKKLWAEAKRYEHEISQF